MEDVLAENGCKGGNEMENNFQFLMYHSAEEDISVNAFIKDETIWLTQRGMAKLFDCSTDNISLHLKNIYVEGELLESTTAEESSVVQTEGARQVRRKAKLYNLDAIISVGYRVNSRRATQFRIWATGILKEYMTKGFVLDDERLKQGKDAFGRDYFRELLERENTFTMEQFAASINEFLSFRRYDILPDRGKISARQAREKAEAEYNLFNPTQKIVSDFDRIVKEMNP